MRYEKIENLGGKEFRRLTGLKPDMLKNMVEIPSLSYEGLRFR